MRIYVVGTVATIAVHHIATDIVISVLDVNFPPGRINWHVKTVILGQVESGPARVGKLYKMEARVDSESNTMRLMYRVGMSCRAFALVYIVGLCQWSR